MDRDIYLARLKARAAESRVYRKFQLDGLEIAQILGDEAHKSLYIKLAKERDPNELRRLAQSVTERAGVKNKGALFMYLLSANSEKHEKNRSVKKPSSRSKKKALNGKHE